MTPSEIRQIKKTYKLMRKRLRDRKDFSFSGFFDYFQKILEIINPK